MSGPALNAICAWCSLTYASHRNGDDLCPGHEGRMDWEASPGTLGPVGVARRAPAR